MFLNTPSNRFLTDRKYEVLYPPTYGVYTGRLDYLKASGKFWSARVSDCIIAHKGKIFIGNGDYDKNTGECPICSYDPLTDQWTVEGTLPTEHILNIREIDDTLWIPCQDHTGGDVDARVFRRKADGTWETISIPFPAQHSFNIAKIDGKIWVDLAQVPDTNKAAVAVSSDGGITWEKIQCYEANGTALPNVTTGNRNRIESGFILVNGEIYGIDTLGASAAWTVVYKYNSTQGKMLRSTNKFLPANVGVYGRFYGMSRYTNVQRYYGPPEGVTFPRKFVIGDSFLGRSYLFARYWIDPDNNAGLYSGGSAYKALYYSRSYALYIPSGEAVMYDFLPELGMFSANSQQNIREEGDYKHYSSRDVVDICALDNKMYVLQVSRINNSFLKISSNEWHGDLPVPIIVSIYSTADNLNYDLEFESTFPTWPTCFTVLDGFAYICMGGNIHLESPWVGAVVKVKLNN